MSQTLTDLENVLRAEVDIHTQMLLAAATKREAIIKGDLPMMESTLRTEHQLLSEIEAAEDLRVALVAQAREELAIEKEQIKLSDIIAHAAEPHAAKLASTRETLRKMIDELRYRSRQNGELLHLSLAHVESFLRAIAEACTSDTGYRRDGSKSGVGGLRLLDQSA